MTHSEDKPIIFAIDDEPHNLELFVRTFTGVYDVKAFVKPSEAITATETITPLLLITDYRMPEMSGVELVKKLRENGVQCATLMVTAFPDLDEVVVAGENRLLFRIIPKPWKPEDLKAQAQLAISSFKLEQATARLEQVMRKK